MKGILMKPEMSLAIRENRKTQTRRLVKIPKWAHPPGAIEMHTDGTIWTIAESSGCLSEIKAKYRVGEVVYVKEGWWTMAKLDHHGRCNPKSIVYRVDNTPIPAGWTSDIRKWNSAMFMPEWAARTFIEITAVKVERVQDISEEDAKAEGCERESEEDEPCTHGSDAVTGYTPEMHYTSAYRRLWNRINKPPHDWVSNPHVFVYTFKKV